MINKDEVQYFFFFVRMNALIMAFTFFTLYRKYEVPLKKNRKAFE